MWITLLFVALAIAMMLGPIMMMQPSKRQRRLAHLRESALEQGMKVRVMQMPEGTVRAGESLAQYYVDWGRDKPLRQTWLLARQPFSHGLHFAGEWDWVNGRQAPSAWHDVLQKALPHLPRSVLAVEAGAHRLGVSWLEQIGDKPPDDAVAELATWLHDLRQALPLPPPRETDEKEGDKPRQPPDPPAP